MAAEAFDGAINALHLPKKRSGRSA